MTKQFNKTMTKTTWSLRFSLYSSFVFLSILIHAQNGSDIKSRVYLRGGIGNSFGVTANELDYPTGPSSVSIENYRAGSGFNLYFGVGVPLNLVDLEFSVEESMQFQFQSTTSSGSFGSSSSRTFQSFFKTNLILGAYFNLPDLANGYNIRLGGGTFYAIPSKGTFKRDGDTWGTFKLNPGVGYFLAGGLMIPIKDLILEPGLRIKISSLDVKENSFEDPENQIVSGDISSIDLMFAVLF